MGNDEVQLFEGFKGRMVFPAFYAFSMGSAVRTNCFCGEMLHENE